MPFVWRKSEYRAFGVLAVADADAIIRQARHLDAVAVGETQGALGPVRIWVRPSGAAPRRKTFHVFASLNVVWLWPITYEYVQ
jgi:hypothetical protein